MTGFPKGKLKSAGFEELNTEQNILVTRVRGPIDMETVKSVTRARFRCFMELDNSKIASILVFQGSMKISRDALELFSTILKSHKEQIFKTIFVAYVLPSDVEDREINCKLFRDIYTQNGMPWQAFKKLEEAQIWAKSMLEGADLTALGPRLK